MKTQKRIAAALTVSAVALTGCYIVPQSDGQYGIYIPSHPGPLPRSVAVPSAVPTAAAPAVAGPAVPAVLDARFYPLNDAAKQTGMVSGSVTNMMSGKGRFQLQYRGDVLSGEATRVSGDERKGVASAYGLNGSFMSCEYQMSSPYQGAGICNFSDGARYQVHLGK
jgi:hypothetical protein